MEIIEEYTVFCILCGTNKQLRMIPHRNRDNKMVGWIFACSDCQPKLADKYLNLSIELKEQDNISTLQDIFDSIACLAVEGPEATDRTTLLEAIRREATRGYNLCKKALQPSLSLSYSDRKEKA